MYSYFHMCILTIVINHTHLDWVAQTLLKFKCQLKLNRDLNLLEMFIELIYT